MRLIDADKVKEYILTEGAYCDTQADKEYTAKMLDELFPTVKAIPIEWIKNYASHKASHDLIDCYWHFWEDDVLKMIADWEKEYEAN